VPRLQPQLSRTARRVLDASVREGKSARQTAGLLEACGLKLAERTVARRMAEVRAENQRSQDMESLGLGFGMAEKGLGSVAELIRRIAPGWRAEQV
jgi:hypothetical protein